ncbi:hypothetical protein D3C72_1841870 [compost metagenome]
MVLPDFRHGCAGATDLSDVQQVWVYEAWARRRQTRVQLRLLDRHVVQWRHGHRTDLLVGCRTHVALRGQPVRHRPHRRSRHHSYANYPIPLGPTSLGYFHHRWPGPCLLCLSQGLAAEHALDPLPADW